MSKKYFHELSVKKKRKVILEANSAKDITDVYIQPDWCSYDNALGGVIGCWNLLGEMVSCKNDCGTCKYIKNDAQSDAVNDS